MTRPVFIVEPQRSSGNGWLACEPYKASTFAVVKTERFMRKRKEYIVRTVIGRYPKYEQAKDLADANTQSYKPLRTYVLGKRIVKDDTRV